MNCGYEIPTLPQNNTIKGDEITRDEFMQRDTTTSTISSQYEYTQEEMSPTPSTVSKSLPNSNDKLSVIFRTVNKLLIMVNV